jgi:hypothetical protein
MSMTIPAIRRAAFPRRLVSPIIAAALMLTFMLTFMLTVCTPALAEGEEDDEVSTWRRVLGTSLGSINGALVARVATITYERSATLALIYAGAVGGGAAIGYATAGSDAALTTMGILMIPLVVVNVVMPPPNRDLEGGLSLPMAAVEIGGPERFDSNRWLSSVLGAMPRPAPGGAQVVGLSVRF